MKLFFMLQEQLKGIKMKSRIVLNAAKCLKCGESLMSEHLTDFKICRCGSIYISGGYTYLMRGAIDRSLILELSIVEELDDETENWKIKNLRKTMSEEKGKYAVGPYAETASPYDDIAEKLSAYFEGYIIYVSGNEIVFVKYECVQNISVDFAYSLLKALERAGKDDNVCL